MKLNEVFMDGFMTSDNIAEIMIYFNHETTKNLTIMEEAFNNNDELGRKKAYNEFVAAEIKYDIWQLLSDTEKQEFFSGKMSENEVKKIINKYMLTLDDRQKSIVRKYIKKKTNE